MSDPISLQIMHNLRDRLYAITPGGGYNTHPSIVFGMRDVNPDELSAGPVVLLYELEDEVVEDLADMCQTNAIELTAVIESYSKLGQDSSPDALAYLWQDINRALFTSDTTCGGLAHSVSRGSRSYIYPSPGGETVAVRQTATILYSEPYGSP